MKLFLASSLDKVAHLLPKNITKGSKVLFVANASDKHEGNKWWVRSDREVFEKKECDIHDLDLRTVSVKDFGDLLEAYDLIHFCGGSVIYLMSVIRAGGLIDVLKKYITEGKILYSGTSAGSMIVAKDLTLCSFDPEEFEYADVKNITDHSGLGVVDFLIIPHCNSAGVIEGNKKMIEQLPVTNQPLIFLYDTQAVFVDDGKIQVVSS